VHRHLEYEWPMATATLCAPTVAKRSGDASRLPRAYILNLDRATDRWESVSRSFAGSGFEILRVPAIDGHALQLPIPEYAESLYHRFHGRSTRLGEIGCYLSHVKAIRAFLDTNDTHALICEDDLTLGRGFGEAVSASMDFAGHWNILRLTGLAHGIPVPVARLHSGHTLCVGMGRLKGLGAYLVDRAGAQVLVHRLLPMRLPIDHALDREWCFGLRAACVYPFPASQTETGFRSSIQRGRSLKLPSLRRALTTYPYQMLNETSRWLFRGLHCLRVRRAARLRRPAPDASASDILSSA
jgi:glycosyl transferase family 25